MNMLNTLLSGGASSRLNKALVDEQQLALFSGGFPFELEDPGVAITFGIANMGVDVMDLQKGIDAEIQKARTELISEKEYQKLRNQLESSFITGNARIAGIAESLANYYMYYGQTDLINTELDRYLAVTREDIRAAAQKYYDPDARVILHYLPKAADQ